jgi:UPF0755 protein
VAAVPDVLDLGADTAPVRRGRHRRSTLVALVVLLVIVAGLAVGWTVWRKSVTTVDDFAGTGDAWTVVRVQGGDSLSDIAETLVANQVVASPEAFTTTTANDADIKALAPGYYRVRQHASAQSTADTLADPANRVGALRIVPGRQLADVTGADGDLAAPGYVSTITQAACEAIIATDPAAPCFTTDDLWAVAETADPVALGVPSWAVDSVLASPDPRRRLEGLILPGDYNIAPGGGPLETLRSVLSASQASWYGTDLVNGAAALGMTPYQVAVVASLVEREAVAADMPQVSRVVQNRLAVPMMLQFDSTVNYALDRASIATSAADRDNPSPWNTYWAQGLPPTPIASPGADALAAALRPAPGPWLFFVKVDLDGTSCFSVTAQEHEACVQRARDNGVFD